MSEKDGGTLEEEVDDAYDQARTMVNNLDPLLKMQGWDYYMGMLQRQINARMQATPQASADFGAVFAKEFRDGEVSGILLAMRLAPGSLEAAKDLLTELLKEKEADVE